MEGGFGAGGCIAIFEGTGWLITFPYYIRRGEMIDPEDIPDRCPGHDSG